MRALWLISTERRYGYRLNANGIRSRRDGPRSSGGSALGRRDISATYQANATGGSLCIPTQVQGQARTISRGTASSGRCLRRQRTTTAPAAQPAPQKSVLRQRPRGLRLRSGRRPSLITRDESLCRGAPHPPNRPTLEPNRFRRLRFRTPRPRARSGPTQLPLGPTSSRTSVGRSGDSHGKRSCR